MNRIEPRNAKISYYTRFSKFLQGSSSVPLFFGGFLRSSIHYSLIYIIYPKTPLACDESTNCFRGKQLVCIQGEYVPLTHHFVCRNFSEDVYAMLGSRPGDGFKSQSQQKMKKWCLAGKKQNSQMSFYQWDDDNSYEQASTGKYAGSSSRPYFSSSLSFCRWQKYQNSPWGRWEKYPFFKCQSIIGLSDN